MSAGSSSVVTCKGRQAGLSLVELMVAVVIALILTAGVIQIFLASNQTYRVNEAVSRVQENARFAVDHLNYQVRMAGFTGCRHIPEVNNILSAPASVFLPEHGVVGWEAVNTAPGQAITIDYGAALAATNSGAWSVSTNAQMPVFQALPGSDILQLWGTADGAVTINNISPGAAQTVVNVAPNNNFMVGDILLMSDCVGADLVQACNVQNIAGGGSTNLVLSAGCVPGNIMPHDLMTSAGGEVFQLRGLLFYVGKRDNQAANPPALFRRQILANGDLGTPEELVEGVENMQVLYGVDNTGNLRVDEYVTANAVTNWRSVLSVKIELLVTSVEANITEGTQALRFNDAVPVVSDRRHRKVVTTTISLRNRMP